MIDRSKLNNSFEFVVIAGARARQLMNGSVPRVERAHKVVDTAQQEVITGKVGKIDEADAAATDVAAK